MLPITVPFVVEVRVDYPPILSLYIHLTLLYSFYLIFLCAFLFRLGVSLVLLSIISRYIRARYDDHCIRSLPPRRDLGGPLSNKIKSRMIFLFRSLFD